MYEFGRETRPEQSELATRKNARVSRATGSDPVSFAAGAYRVVAVVGLLWALVGLIIRWEGASELGLWAAAVALVCLELARIAGRVGPPSIVDLGVSVSDARVQRRLLTLTERVGLIAIMANTHPGNAAYERARKELDFLEQEDG